MSDIHPDADLSDEPKHDHPDGPVMGWSAADFGPGDYATPEEQDAAGVLLTDGADHDAEERLTWG